MSASCMNTGRQGEIAFQYSLTKRNKRRVQRLHSGGWKLDSPEPFPRRTTGAHSIELRSHALRRRLRSILSPDDTMATIPLHDPRQRPRAGQCLAWHGTVGDAGKPSAPDFAADDRWVIYNSDVEKCHNVYMVDTHSV